MGIFTHGYRSEKTRRGKNCAYHPGQELAPKSMLWLWTSLLSLPTVLGRSEAWESILSKQGTGALPQKAGSLLHTLDCNLLPH